MRAIGSTEPPGGNGTIILMMPDGQVCACAVNGVAKGALMAPSTSPRRVIFMVPSQKPLLWLPAYKYPATRAMIAAGMHSNAATENTDAMAGTFGGAGLCRLHHRCRSKPGRIEVQLGSAKRPAARLQARPAR